MKKIYRDYKLQNLGYTLQDEQNSMKLFLYQARRHHYDPKSKDQFRSWVHF